MGSLDDEKRWRMSTTRAAAMSRVNWGRVSRRAVERAIAAQLAWSWLGTPGRTLSFFPAAVVDVQDLAEADEHAEEVRELGRVS